MLRREKHALLHTVQPPSACALVGNPITTSSQKVLQYTSNANCHALPICIATHLQFVSQCFSVPLSPEEERCSQCSSRLYRGAPPTCIAIRPPLASQYFWETIGGWGGTICKMRKIQLTGLMLTGFRRNGNLGTLLGTPIDGCSSKEIGHYNLMNI